MKKLDIFDKVISKYKVIYNDFEEIIEDYEADSLVKIDFFFSDTSIFRNEINAFEAFRLDNDLKVELKDFKHNIKAIGGESISFKMPNFDIRIKCFKVKNTRLCHLSVDVSNIKEILFGNNLTNGSYITQAIFSDYYDLGFSDYYFDELKTANFILNSKFKVVLMILEDKNVNLLFSGKIYKPAKKNLLKYNSKTIYEYIFTNIELNKEGIIKFEIN